MPASPYSSVQQARRIVADHLREVMKDAGIRTGRELAVRLGWQESKVSRILNAITPPSEDDVREWCAACDAADEVPGLISSLRMAASAYVEWRRMERGGLRSAQESVWPLYERTTRFRDYCSCVLSGLAQTRGYTEAVLRNVQRHRGLVDDVEDAVRVRMDRQRVLADPSRSFVFVLEESVLRFCVADVEVMAEQLGHLLHLATLPNVLLGVIPFGRRRFRSATKDFFMYDDTQVAVELVGAYLTVTQPTELVLYEQAFAEYAAMAVYGKRARKLIAAAVDALD